MSLETIGPLKAFQLHCCPDIYAIIMVKRLIFLQKSIVIHTTVAGRWAGAVMKKVDWVFGPETESLELIDGPTNRRTDRHNEM